MAWPAGTSVRSLIADDIKSTLETIVGGPNYKTTVEAVRLMGHNVMQLTEFPSVIVSPPRATYADQRLDLLMVELSFTLALMTREVDRAIAPGLIYDLIDDVRVALFVDETRGGNALDTHVVTDDPYALDVQDPLFGADVTVTVNYRTLRDDPSTSM